MDFKIPSSAAEATQIQKDLAQKIVLEDSPRAIRTIAGIDVGYDIQSNFSRATIAVMDINTLELEMSVLAVQDTLFPYIPGLLSFREIPVILRALEMLKTMPDLLMVDGQGIAHPRRLGIAAHLGVLLDRPTIGVAKSRLCGTYKEPGLHKGARENLIDKGDIIGMVLRPKDNVKPLFVSPGHKVSRETAVDITMKTLTKYRLPEPTRIADKLSKKNPVPRKKEPDLLSL